MSLSNISSQVVLIVALFSCVMLKVHLLSSDGENAREDVCYSPSVSAELYFIVIQRYCYSYYYYSLILMTLLRCYLGSIFKA